MVGESGGRFSGSAIYVQDISITGSQYYDIQGDQVKSGRNRVCQSMADGGYLRPYVCINENDHEIECTEYNNGNSSRWCDDDSTNLAFVGLSQVEAVVASLLSTCDISVPQPTAVQSQQSHIYGALNEAGIVHE